MNWINITTLCLSLFLCGLSSSILNPFFPMETLSRGISIAHCGFILGIKFLACAFSSVIVGTGIGVYLSAKHVIAIGLFLVFVCNVLFSFLFFILDPTVFFIIAITLRIALAFGETAVLIAGYSLAGVQGEGKHQGVMTAVADSSYGVGLMVGPAAGGEMYQVGGFMLPFLVLGGVGIFQCVLVMSVMRPREGEGEYQHVDDKEKCNKEKDGKSNNITWNGALSVPVIFLRYGPSPKCI